MTKLAAPTRVTEYDDIPDQVGQRLEERKTVLVQDVACRIQLWLAISWKVEIVMLMVMFISEYS